MPALPWKCARADWHHWIWSEPCFRVTYFDDTGAEQIYGSWWDMGDALAPENAVSQNWADATVDFKTLEDFLAERLKYRGPRRR